MFMMISTTTNDKSHVMMALANVAKGVGASVKRLSRWRQHLSVNQIEITRC